MKLLSWLLLALCIGSTFGAEGPSWIDLGSTTSGSGVTTVTLIVQPNTETTNRSGAFSVADLSFTVTQQAGVIVAPGGPWVKQFGGVAGDCGRAVGTDGSGNIVAASVFAGTAAFGGINFTSAGGNDIALAKYSSAGVHQWSKRFGGTAGENPSCIQIAASGKIVVGGTFGTGSANFGGSNISGAGNVDGFIASYSPDGTHLWSRGFGSTGVDTVSGVSFDSQENVIVTGTFQGSITLGGTNLTSAGGGTDLFVAKYSSTGAHLWSRNFPNTSNDYAKGVAVDQSGNIFITGYFVAWIDFGAGRLVSSDPTFGGPEVFIAKLTPAGSLIWARRYGADMSEKASAIALDSNGDVFITGEFDPYTDLGCGSLSVTLGASLYSDSFIAKYSGADGACRWAKAFGGSSSEVTKALVSDTSGNILVTGVYRSTCYFDSLTTSSLGGDDIFVAKYSPSGSVLWTETFGGINSESVFGLTVDGNGYCTLTGGFSGTATFRAESLTAFGSMDAFILRLEPWQ